VSYQKGPSPKRGILAVRGARLKLETPESLTVLELRRALPAECEVELKCDIRAGNAVPESQYVLAHDGVGLKRHHARDSEWRVLS
jgi:hypothetical protein